MRLRKHARLRDGAATVAALALTAAASWTLQRPPVVERLAARLEAEVAACPLDRLELEGKTCLRAPGRSPVEWEARLRSTTGVDLRGLTQGDAGKRRVVMRYAGTTWGALAVPGVLVLEPPGTPDLPGQGPAAAPAAAEASLPDPEEP